MDNLKLKMGVSDIVHMGTVSRWNHLELSRRFHEYLRKLPKRVPRYQKQWAMGYFEAKRDHIIHNEVEFCYLKDGQLVSTHKRSPRYYGIEIYGYEASDLSDCLCGHFWKGSNKPWGATEDIQKIMEELS